MDKQDRKEKGMDILWELAGCFIMATGLYCFWDAARVAPGGVSGLAIMAGHLWGAPVGTSAFILNIPLLLLAWKYLGKGFALRTLRVTFFSAVMLDGGGSSSCWFRGETILSDQHRKIHDYILVFLKKEELPMGVKTYSRKLDGSTYLSANFKVSEFACSDGTDKVLISDELVDLLQEIRDHFGAAVTINSGYRTKTHNEKVGGSPKSQHMLGTAADIVVKGADPLTVAQYAEYLLPESGGIGVYKTFTHVDVRANRSRWDSRSGKETGVSGWPGYEPPKEPTETENAVAWVQEAVIMQGNADGDMMLDSQPTRRQIALMLYRFWQKFGK